MYPVADAAIVGKDGLPQLHISCQRGLHQPDKRRRRSPLPHGDASHVVVPPDGAGSERNGRNTRGVDDLERLPVGGVGKEESPEGVEGSVPVSPSEES